MSFLSQWSDGTKWLMGILSALIIGVVMTAINRPHPPPEEDSPFRKALLGTWFEEKEFPKDPTNPAYRIRMRARYDYLSNGAFRTEGELRAGEDTPGKSWEAICLGVFVGEWTLKGRTLTTKGTNDPKIQLIGGSKNGQRFGPVDAKANGLGDSCDLFAIQLPAGTTSEGDILSIDENTMRIETSGPDSRKETTVYTRVEPPRKF